MVTAIVLVGLVGCHKDNQTATDILTGTNGWVLSTAFSDPRYHLSDGGYASDLINDGYLNIFEAYYILVFTSTGGEIVKPGDVPAPSDGEGFFKKETTLGNWEFNNPDNPTTITMYIPFLYKEGLINCQILNLTKDEFKIKFKVQDDEESAKKTCTFTLTYVPL